MSVSDYLYIFFVLGVLLGIMYLLLLVVKKFLYNSKSLNNGKINFSVVTTKPIMPKKYVSIIKVKEKYYLLGVSENSINLIDKLNPDDIEIKNDAKSDFSKPSFMELFKKNMGLK